MGSPEIPIIDIGGLVRKASAKGVGAVARQIRDACLNTGFFYISNHGVSERLIAETIAANRTFHARPIEEKLRLKLNRWHRGFEPFAASKLVSSKRFEPAKQANQLESYVVRQEVRADDPGYGTKELMGPNQWPDDPAFKDVVERYDAALRDLGLKLLPAFSVAVGENPNFFTDLMVPPATAMRMIHYSPSPKPRPSDLYGIQPHTDYGFITMLAQDEIGGLEVRRVDGSWIDARPIRGTFIVNIGDTLARWTNNVFNSTPHRVINRSDLHSRYSMAMFFDPHVDTIVRCLEGFKDDAAPEKYDPIRYGDYLLGRLNTNHPIGVQADAVVG